MKDVYQIVTDRIIGALQNGVVPWHKPWKGGNNAPKNLVSKKEYRGLNVFLLNSLGYSSNYWLTFKQAQELGGNVKRGEKSCPVVFWKWLDVDEEGERRRIPFLRYYSVFNLAQCEGIDEPIKEAEPCPSSHNPIESAEQIVAGMPQKPLIKHGMDQAFYSPGGDYVGMPDPERFSRSEDYYSVLFHELTHSTGHESRLSRKRLNDWNAFGSHDYSKEELVAEMGAAFLCGHAGIVDRTVDNSAAYISSWLQRLKNDVRFVVQAAAQAQRAADFILGKTHRETTTAAESEEVHQ